MSKAKEYAGKAWAWLVEYAKNHKWKTIAIFEALWIGFTS